MNCLIILRGTFSWFKEESSQDSEKNSLSNLRKIVSGFWEEFSHPLRRIRDDSEKKNPYKNLRKTLSGFWEERSHETEENLLRTLRRNRSGIWEASWQDSEKHPVRIQRRILSKLPSQDSEKNPLRIPRRVLSGFWEECSQSYGRNSFKFQNSETNSYRITRILWRFWK